MARYTPASVGKSEQWSSIVSTAEFLQSSNWEDPVFTLQELKVMLKVSTPNDQSKTPMSTATQVNGFKEVWRCKQHSTNETAPTSKKVLPTAAAVDTPPPPPRRSPPGISSPCSKHLAWTWIPPTPRPNHMRQQLLLKQVDRPQ
jgi:hypothetical protein